MLHEILKYPSLEKVIGLELDQTVVRKSFKYFRTQAHFDDDRVEWWFGDATKSLLMLPKDYWGSFDLVIVDLSETVMAYSVTEELDVFDALALLLNPDGVMVKNEHYMETMSETFDYTLQIYLDENPKICSQCMIFGSNRADFLRRPLKDHNVETLLLPKVNDLSISEEYFHDFRKNDAMKQGKCNIDNMKDKAKESTTVQSKAVGLLHILDAEDVSVNLEKDIIEKIILLSADIEGLTLISSNKEEKYSTKQYAMNPPEKDNGFFTFVFEEGYVSVRYWPKLLYCALDVGMWGSYDKGDSLRKIIGRELKAKTKSYFRIVVGGMFGSSTWQEDQDSVGPQIVQQRKCKVAGVDDIAFSDEPSKQIVLEEFIDLLGFPNTLTIVLCGNENVDTCSSIEVLEKLEKVGKVVPIWTCPELSEVNEDSPDKFAKMSKCEMKVFSKLRESAAVHDSAINLFVLDDSMPYIMGQIFHSIMTVSSYREKMVKDEAHFIVSLSFKPKSETWKRNILERYRKELHWDPATRVEINVNVGNTLMEIGIFAIVEGIQFSNYKTLEQRINDRLSVHIEANSSAEIISITGALFPFQHDFNPHHYLQTDYRDEPGNKQWSEQKSLGRKIVLQYEADRFRGHRMPELDSFVSLIDNVVTGYGLYQFDVYTDVGDGVMIVSDFKLGSLIALWDGRERIDLNLYLFYDAEYDAKAFVDQFSKLSKNMLKLNLRDDFPRGTGRVMNFKEDMSYKGYDSILNLEPYVDPESDEEDKDNE